MSAVTPRSLSADAIPFAVPLKNKSEMLLEGYFRNQGYDDFDFEPEIAGTTGVLIIGCAGRALTFYWK